MEGNTSHAASMRTCPISTFNRSSKLFSPRILTFAMKRSSPRISLSTNSNPVHKAFTNAIIVPRNLTAYSPVMRSSCKTETRPSNTFLDWWIKATRSQISSTLRILCEEIIMVLPRAFISSNSCLMSSTFTGSKPEKGSSKINRSGSCKTVQMNCTFCAIPLESSSIRFLRQF